MTVQIQDISHARLPSAGPDPGHGEGRQPARWLHPDVPAAAAGDGVRRLAGGSGTRGRGVRARHHPESAARRAARGSAGTSHDDRARADRVCGGAAVPGGRTGSRVGARGSRAPRAVLRDLRASQPGAPGGPHAETSTGRGVLGPRCRHGCVGRRRRCARRPAAGPRDALALRRRRRHLPGVRGVGVVRPSRQCDGIGAAAGVGREPVARPPAPGDARRRHGVRDGLHGDAGRTPAGTSRRRRRSPGGPDSWSPSPRPP